MIRNRQKSIFIFVLLSVLIHASFVVSFYWKPPTPPHQPPEVVEVSYESPPPAPEVAPPDMTEEEKKKAIEKEIVEQKQQLNDEIDKKTTRLSAFNQKVIQETKAAQSGKFNNSAKGGKPETGTKEGEKKSKVTKKTKAPREPGELPDLNDLVPKLSDTAEPQSVTSENPGEASQSDDYLKDVKTGMQTLLSTREFVYFSYYQRIKDQIRQYWEPGVREKVKIVYRQGRTIASQKDRMTQLMVTLDSQGGLLKVEVLSSSGVQQLDDAAIEAFKSAAPFPNPPGGMVESDGTIKIRWDFILEAAIHQNQVNFV